MIIKFDFECWLSAANMSPDNPLSEVTSDGFWHFNILSFTDKEKKAEFKWHWLRSDCFNCLIKVCTIYRIIIILWLYLIFLYSCWLDFFYVEGIWNLWTSESTATGLQHKTIKSLCFNFLIKILAKTFRKSHVHCHEHITLNMPFSTPRLHEP